MGQGPLDGVKIVEFAGIGPGPFCGMLLSDLGADVIRIDRAGGTGIGGTAKDVTGRGRRSVALNLKAPGDVDTALSLIERADGLIEGFRPGVMERLGLGPDVALARNPRLVYGRMTGWGQTGPLAHAAGHDLNYIALTGALHAMGRKGERPSPPLNLVGDYGGGALYLAFGLCAGIIHARTSGEGQVIDCAMTDGAASLAAMFFGMRASGIWTDDREANLLDGGAHFYDTYECADGNWVAIGSIEPQFYALLIEKAGLLDVHEGFASANQMNRNDWPELKTALIDVFKTKSQAEWCEIMEGTDICFAPVLSMAEAPGHAHNQARGTFVEYDGVAQPAPAPRFSRTPGEISRRSPAVGEHTEEVLADWGVER
ncbi:MAG: CaiB/BaiF CoA-transferase family protein [Pseudomonadota bacterium]